MIELSLNQQFDGECGKHFIRDAGIESLPFYRLDFIGQLTRDLEAITPWLHSFGSMVVLGMGGSSLGAKALRDSFAGDPELPARAGRRLHVVDNLDGMLWQKLLDILDPHETVFAVISKSGSTLETVAMYQMAKQWMRRQCPSDWQDHFLVIADEDAGYLRSEAEENGMRTLPIPSKLGGRYSVFSAVGMVPLAFLDPGYRVFLRGALAARDRFMEEKERSQICRIASWIAQNSGSKPICLLFNWIPSWKSLNPWFAQLWAESLGKAGKGSTPVTAVGCTDLHSQLQLYLDGPSDKICLYLSSGLERCLSRASSRITIQDAPEAFGYLNGLGFADIYGAQCAAIRETLGRHGMPLISIRVGGADMEHFGEAMWTLGMLTILTGRAMGIDPLDQPAVEEGKILTRSLLKQKGGA